MARKRAAATLEEILGMLGDRIRVLELARGQVGNWTLVEDQGTGELLAVRDNGQDVAKTIVVLAP